jgi:hypothetical protein
MLQLMWPNTDWVKVPVGPPLGMKKGKFFFCVYALVEEGLPDPLTSLNSTHVPPIMTAMEFVTGTRPLEVTFGIPISL